MPFHHKESLWSNKEKCCKAVDNTNARTWWKTIALRSNRKVTHAIAMHKVVQLLKNLIKYNPPHKETVEPAKERKLTPQNCLPPDVPLQTQRIPFAGLRYPLGFSIHLLYSLKFSLSMYFSVLLIFYLFFFFFYFF